MVAPTPESLHMLPKSLIRPSEISIQDVAKSEIYSDTSKRTFGLKKFEWYLDFFSLHSISPLLAFPRGPET